MARERVNSSGSPQAFAIHIILPGGVAGWMTGRGGSVVTFPSAESAAKALKQLIKSGHYSWLGTTVEVREFPG